MSALVWLLGSPLGRWLVGLGGMALAVGAFALDQRSRGAEAVVVKLERQDNAAAERIRKADAASRNAARGVRGVVRDPNSVAE